LFEDTDAEIAGVASRLRAWLAEGMPQAYLAVLVRGQRRLDRATAANAGIWRQHIGDPHA
jgi:hypothetical protein